MVRTWKLAAFAAALVGLAVLVAAPVGCTTKQIEQARQALADARENSASFDESIGHLVQQKALVDAQIETLLPGPAKEKAKAASKELGNWIAGYRKHKATIDKTVATLEAKLAKAVDGPDVLQAVGETAAPFAGGYGPLVVLAATTAAGVWRAVRNGRRAAAAEVDADLAEGEAQVGRRVIGAIDAVKIGGKIDFDDTAIKAKLSAAMGAEGKALVDDVQANG